MNLYDFFIEPFTSFLFMKRALVACIALSLGCAPIGVLLVLRRMSLMGDALSHSILPGVALGYMVAGLSLPIMGIGGFAAGLVIAFLATLVSRYTVLKEDASFVGFYLLALSAGAIIISAVGSSVDLLHILFGQILAITPNTLILMAGISTVTIGVLSIIYRPLMIECYDPIYMRSIGAYGAFYHIVFMMLVVLNMIAAFQALGTLMALGMMMMPAVTARFWGREVWSLFIISLGIALLSGLTGLLVSYHYKLPSGPSIILVAGILYLVSILLGTQGSIRSRIFR
jgi:zinc/manganese transport system permease protein